ncbi:RICIN domain-containing protein [Streptomyces sp. NPDC048295]|uniref:RICIN domain-containing protein n=1 Tax=Streptomyces sp. NPDC048295 TaxID=3154617 RepID=UPI0034268F5C
MAAAVLAAVSLTVAAPTHAATPSAAKSQHANSALAPATGTEIPEANRYVIHNVGAAPGTALGIGPVPLIYPPIDVPVRNLSGGFVERWVVTPVGNGLYTIIAGQGRPAEEGRPGDYALVERGDAVFVSATKQPGQWTIEPAGGGRWTIGVPNSDKVITLNRDDEFPPVVLAPRNGSDAQLWDSALLD